MAAVGASAGGVVAFSGLLRNIPADAPLALLLVQHLAPEQPSILSELLGGATGMPVVNARDRLPLQPGHVYVIPPKTVMTVEDGMLRVRDRTNGRPSHGDGPVDALFRSLATEYRQRAVGIVLSGAGSDGANGVREIKEGGGITFAQAPEDADIDGMPRSAIATGSVDAVLTAPGIAEQLVRLAEHPFFRHQASEIDPELDLPSASGQRRRIFQLLRRATGVDFNNYKTPTITRRIQRRMALHRMSLLSEYVTFLERDPRELQRLQADLLIHVTSFFREPESFGALADHVLPKLLRNHADTPFRAWVPGCSTGEETYSLAMVLLEFLGERSEQIPLQVFSTDISDSTIDQARAGTYPTNIAAHVSPERLRRFFAPFDGGYRISKAVRDCCVFARQDVTRDPPFSKLDLVVCRNLLIYLTQATQRKVMGVFHYALNPEGVLMLGRSETASPNADLFSVIDKRFQLYVRKPGRVRMEIEFAPIHAEAPLSMPKDQPSGPLRVGATSWDAQTDANRFLLDHYAPPAVILDRDLKIVRSRGVTSRFIELPSGEVTLDVLKMVRPELLFGTRAVVHEALTTGKAAVRNGLHLRNDQEAGRIDLRAIPLGSGEGRQIMLVFEEPRPSKGGSKVRERGKKTGGSAKGVLAGLQDELIETRQQLQAIIDDLAATNEELQSANEEVLSSNEELQSTNEELDTAKEELQSTNEELSTLNDELHGRNEELSRVNSDLVNLLSSVQIPIVMVGQDLKIRRFTPAAEKTLNIIPSDVGRPIGHLKPNFACPELETLISEVTRSRFTTARWRAMTDGCSRCRSDRTRASRTASTAPSWRCSTCRPPASRRQPPPGSVRPKTPFCRVPDPNAPSRAGLGLGLAICRGIVHLHEGQINVTSPGLGKGSRFIIDFPTIAEPAMAPLPRLLSPRPYAAMPPLSTFKPRILLVEDDADTAETLADLLDGEGFHITVVHSVAEALKQDVATIDLVLSDLGLGDGSGLELMRALRRKKDVQGIALSGYGTESDIRASKDAGFCAHLIKPVSLDKLVAAIRRVQPTAEGDDWLTDARGVS